MVINSKTKVTKNIPKMPCGLVLKLWRMQEKAKEKDADFAQSLGISKALWTATKYCFKQVGLSLLQGVVRKYPELEPDVIDYLRKGK